MKHIKYKQCLAALFLSSLMVISIAGCGKDKPVETSSTTAEDTEETEDEEEEDEDLSDFDETEENLEDYLEDKGLDVEDTDDGLKIEAENGDYIIIETEETTKKPGPYVYDGDFNHSELDDKAQECAHNGWVIEVLTAEDLGLTSKQYGEGFVTYDDNGRPHYYLFYKDAETAYDNLVDYILDDNATISEVATPDDTVWLYTIHFDSNDHYMEATIYDDGYAIFDDIKATIVSYDPDSDTYPVNMEYETPEINDLAKQYDEQGYQLFNLGNDYFDFDNAVEGFSGYSFDWSDDFEDDTPPDSYEIFVMKYDDPKDAAADLKKVFGYKMKTSYSYPLSLEFTDGMTSYTGTLSEDGLLILKGVESWDFDF